MCIDPVTLTAISTAVAVAGQVASSSARAGQANYAARVADRNAQLEADAGRDAAARGQVERVNLQREQAGLQGQQNAALAASGIDIGFGTAALVRGDTVRIQGEDVATLNANTAREVQGYNISASNQRAEAAAKRSEASGAKIQGLFGIGSTVLGGVQQYKRAKWNARSSNANPWG